MGHGAWRHLRLSARSAAHAAAAAAAALLLFAAVGARAQELEPRAYSASPVGTNFAVVGYSRLRGDVLTDPSLPVTDIQARIDLYVAGYARTFALGERTASFGIVVPYAQADVSGNVFDAPREVSRAGIGDVRLRLAVNLFGNPAVTLAEFVQRPTRVVAGASFTVVAPTGQYEPARLINVGSNRWAFKPELGVSWPIGDWFIETSAGAWIFGDNRNFLGANRRGQEPLYIMQLHAGYNFRPGLWLAFNAAYGSGGRTNLNGVEGRDVQQNSRYGATLAVPLDKRWSAKFGWSKGLATRAGGDYETLAVVLQYRWFDP